MIKLGRPSQKEPWRQNSPDPGICKRGEQAKQQRVRVVRLVVKPPAAAAESAISNKPISSKIFKLAAFTHTRGRGRDEQDEEEKPCSSCREKMMIMRC